MEQPANNPPEFYLAKWQNLYRQMVPIASYPPWESVKSLECQQQIRKHVLQDPVVQKYPPARKYTIRFLKAYVDYLQRNREELDDELLEMFLDLMNAPPVESGDRHMREVSYRTYTVDPETNQTVTVRLAEQLDTVGLTTWEAGFFLAEYMASNKELFNNKRCVELGSGIGLTGAVLMSVAQPSHTILTDYLDSVLANLETNIKINFPDTPESSNTTLPSWEAKRVDWEVDDVDSLNFDAEVIFAADVVYDRALIVALIRVMKSLLSHTTSSGVRPQVIIATTLRNPATLGFFLTELQSKGITVEDISKGAETRKRLFEYPPQTIYLHRLTVNM